MATIVDPVELARCLVRDLGKDAAIRYADMISRNTGDIGNAYKEAARLIRSRTMCVECGLSPVGSPGGVCEGCEAYAEHTSIY